MKKEIETMEEIIEAKIKIFKEVTEKRLNELIAKSVKKVKVILND